MTKRKAIYATAALSASAAMALLAAGPSNAMSSKRASPDPYVPSGEAVDCIPIAQISSTQVRDDRTIDFKLGSKVYRNTLPYKCSSLGFEKRFSYSTSQSQLCSVDIIHVLYTMGGGLQHGASCGLGKFQPMTKK